jgi:hypothetical protein
MSNRPFTDFPIDPNTTSGTELAEILDRFQQSVDSMNLGNGRPSYLEAGGLWTKGRSGTIDLYLFDGTKDVLVAGSGTGDGGMAISEQPPSSPSVGDMWMRLPNNVVMIWNGDFWFQFPSSGGGSSSGGDLPAGLERGQTLKWNGTAWEPSDVLRIHPGGVEAVDVSGKLHLHPVGTDPNGADMSRGPYGSVLECDVYWNATDGWTGLKNDWNISWIRPNDDNLNANRRNAFDVIADKFVVRLSPAPADDPWYDREIVFRAEEQSVSIGARDYRSKVFVHGDCYLGMSENFYGKILPTNPDDKPGTFFCGGQSMLGSYIEGEPLTPINQAEIDDPSLIRQRAFVQDAALDMAANPIYNTGSPDDPRWALLRDKMCVTVEWIEKNAIVDDGSGTVVSKTSTILGDTNDDTHQLIGDVYVGYEDKESLPNNDDDVGGTLFLKRGMIVGRDNAGNASIGMEGNVIFDLGDPVSQSCAVSKGYVERELVGDIKQLEDDVDTNQVNIVNMYNEQIKQALQIQALQNAQREMALSVKDAVSKSTKFAELKDNLMEAMEKFL